MAQTTLGRVIQPGQQGSIVVPDDIREALGVTASTRLLVRLVDDQIVISKVEEPAELGEPAESAVRIYTDEEIAEFLEEDKLSPELEQWLRSHIPPHQRRFWEPDDSGLS